MSVCQHVYLCTTCLPGVHRGQRASPETRHTEGCESPCRWELNLCALVEQRVTLTAGPYLQPLLFLACTAEPQCGTVPELKTLKRHCFNTWKVIEFTWKLNFWAKWLIRNCHHSKNIYFSMQTTEPSSALSVFLTDKISTCCPICIHCTHQVKKPWSHQSFIRPSSCG